MLLPIQKALRKFKNPRKTEVLSSFFKTGKGQYGEGDLFLGLSVLQIRNIIKDFRSMPTSDLEILIQSKYHEERLAAVLILVNQYQKGDSKIREEIFDFYLKHAEYVNNWDLVDLSAAHIVGGYLSGLKNRMKILKDLAGSANMWERRISMISCFYDIKKGDPDTAFVIAGILLKDRHDLIHKAIGWMLREIGKNDKVAEAERFIRKNLRKMPRTTLRYAIERWPEKKRKAILAIDRY